MADVSKISANGIEYDVTDLAARADIADLQSTSGGGYCKYADGTMIQWGTATVAMPTMTQIAASGVYFALVTLTFPQAFVNTSFDVNGNSKYSTGYQVPFGGVPASANSATVHIYDFYARASGNVVLHYTAVGRWK